MMKCQFSLALLGIALAVCITGCKSQQSSPNSTTQPKPTSAWGKLGDSTQQFWDYITGNTPIKAVREMENARVPDQRRIGINYLASRSFGQKAPYTTRYEQIARTDPDWLVRATAIRALNRARDARATPLFIKSLTDSSELVRLEACKALANVPDPNASPGLVKLVNDPAESRDIRIAAADALRYYKTLEVARTLVNTLDQREFGVSWQSRQSLKVLTGKDLQYDEAAWLTYLSTSSKPIG
jgi:hypothetical protein